VVCALQPSCATEGEAVPQKLHVIPTLKALEAESIDVPAVIRRHSFAPIDGLAHENPPGTHTDRIFVSEAAHHNILASDRGQFVLRFQNECRLHVARTQARGLETGTHNGSDLLPDSSFRWPVTPFSFRSSWMTRSISP
jgi:hypothetical protein